ncbi:4-hydroxyphenylacetate 3-hydroxylase C-terminal domain-containing protein [Bacillus pacificus]
MKKSTLKEQNIDAEQRTKLFKLAWDIIGSPLGSRHELYERFFAGDPM